MQLIDFGDKGPREAYLLWQNLPFTCSESDCFLIEQSGKNESWKDLVQRALNNFVYFDLEK